MIGLRCTLLACALTLLLIAGCPTMTPTGNGNDNGNANTTNNNTNVNANTNDNGNTDLSATQRSDIARLSTVIDEFMKFAQQLTGLATDDIDFTNLGGLGLIGANGTCPNISFINSPEVPQVVIGVVFNPACTAGATGNVEVAGDIEIELIRATRMGTIELSSFSVDGQSVTGGATVTIAGNATVGVSIDGTFNITINGTSTASGVLSLSVNADGSLTVAADAIALDDGTGALTVAIDDLVINPASNGNFVPQSGTTTVTSDGSTLVISYDAESPTSGMVDVTIDGTGPVMVSVTN